jgi:curved DNA-binding protein CbpA
MARQNHGTKDYYAILGVAPGSTADEVRKAYRRLALEWHPDRNQGRPEATERFKEISEAYGVLIDPEKRQQYDEVRAEPAGREFGYSQEDVLRDLFANRGAAAIFEEIARELERNGVRVDRQYFHKVLSGGTVVSGGIFVITPLTPVLGMFKLARAALSGIAHLGKALLGTAAGGLLQSPGQERAFPLRLTGDEARQGTNKRVSVKLEGKNRNFLVKVPPGVQQGTKLRLRSPEKTVYLSVEITE